MLRDLPAPPGQLMGKVLHHPDRALLRLILLARLAWKNAESERDRLLGFLSEQCDVDANAMRSEYLDSGFAAWFEKRLAELHNCGATYKLGTTPGFDCETLYLVVRAARPRLVVETGVLYGASSAHILEALERNGEGTLYSIELEGDPHGPSHDFFVPERLKKRWQLILGDSRHELPLLLHRLGGIDHFHHDSLHTSEHMRWEYETAFRYLHPGGIMSSDDVLISHSLRELRRANAFTRFCEQHRVQWSTCGNVGIAIRGTALE